MSVSGAKRSLWLNYEFRSLGFWPTFSTCAATGDRGARGLRAGRRLAALERLADGLRLAVDRRFGVVRRFGGIRFFRDFRAERDAAPRFLRFAICCLLSGQAL
jgi:hypothetical protein